MAVDPTAVPVLRSETDRSILFLTLKQTIVFNSETDHSF